MSTLEEKLSALLSDYEPIEDPQERLALFTDSHKRHAGLPAELRTDDHRVRACVSAAWICGEMREGRVHFRCAADSPLVEGLLAGLCAFFSEAPPQAVAASELSPLAALGLLRNLSPTRLNGLEHARKRLREIAATQT